MGTNYERFLHILSKWPTQLNRSTLDYGHHLRKLIKNKDVDGNVFPGNSAENSKMLDSLLRLLNNTYQKKYPSSGNYRASSVSVKSIEEILNSTSASKKLEK